MSTVLTLLIKLLLVAQLANARLTKSLQVLKPSEAYTHSLTVDEDNPAQYQVFWKALSDEIQFEVHCKTSGWVGIGLSANGGMAGSDIAIGWIKNGRPFIKDCYAKENVAPMVDKQQDLNLIDGAEVDGYTILKFKRKLVTCDKDQDKEIKIGTQYMIFAWNDAKPETGENDWKYHGTKNRIQRTLMLLSFKNESLYEQEQLPADTFTSSLTFKNIQVPADKNTYYFCDVFELPKFNNPVHLIQFEMIVNRRNKQHVHHLLAYECEDGFAPSSPVAQQCGTVPLPDYVSRNCMQKLIVAWGIGGQYNYSFPRKAGYLFEVSEVPKYILVEMHYDNPKFHDDIIDDSGIKLYFTEQRREHDLGLLTLGAGGGFTSLQIRPQSSNSVFTSICYPQCTEKYFPDDGIYAVSALLHTHLAGRSVKTTLVRDNVIIKDLFDNPNYDFNYQFILGDVLITKCKFNTNDRTKFTFFGFGTMEEMCYSFIYYYPRMPKLQNCFSNMLIPLEESEIEEYAYDDFLFMDFMQTNVVMTPKLVIKYEEFYATSYNKTISCTGSTDDDLFIRNV